MSKLVFINACIRQADSRTLRIAQPIIDELSRRYETIRYDLPEIEGIVPLTPALFAERGRGAIPSWAMDAAKNIAEADRILIAALLGMYLFRHKNQHRKFTLGIPAILLIQAALAYFFLIP